MKLKAIAASLVVATFTTGCTYHSTSPVSASYDVYSSYSQKLPGSYALFVDSEEFQGEFSPQSFTCGAHSYSQDARAPFRLSVIKTYENLVDQVVPVDRPLNQQQLAQRGLDGQIAVRADAMDVQIRGIPGFWMPDIEVNVELAANMTVNSRIDRLLGTTVSGDGDALTSAGGACGGGSEALSIATSDAMEDLLQRLGERLSNSPRVRENASQKQLDDDASNS